jgi:hypothetical protein
MLLPGVLEEGDPSLVDCMVVVWWLYGGCMVILKVSGKGHCCSLHANSHGRLLLAPPVQPVAGSSTNGLGGEHGNTNWPHCASSPTPPFSGKGVRLSLVDPLFHTKVEWLQRYTTSI